MELPEDWTYIGFREDIHDHCQYCNRETNRLHWFRMNESQVATICDPCYQAAKKEAMDMSGSGVPFFKLDKDEDI